MCIIGKEEEGVIKPRPIKICNSRRLLERFEDFAIR